MLFIYHISGQKDDSKIGVVNKPSYGIPTIPLQSQTLTRSYRKISSDIEFSKRRLSLGNASKFVKIPEHCITLPITCSTSVVFSVPKHTTGSTHSDHECGCLVASPKMANEADSDFKLTVPRCDMPLPPLPSAQMNDHTQLSVQQSTKKLDRALMPLPPTPLDFDELNEGSSASVVQQSSEKFDRSLMPLPPTPLDAVLSSGTVPVEVDATDASNDKNVKEDSIDDACIEECSSSSNGYERINFGLLEQPLPSTTHDTAVTVGGITSDNSNEDSCTTTESIKQANNGQITTTHGSTNSSLPSAVVEMPASAIVNGGPLSIADTGAAIDNETTNCSDEDYIIGDYEFYSMQKQQKALVVTDDIDKVSSTPKYLELKCLDPAVGNVSCANIKVLHSTTLLPPCTNNKPTF